MIKAQQLVRKLWNFCRELDARIKDFASGLRSLGLAKGDKVKHKFHTNSLSIVSAAPCSTWRLTTGLLYLPQRCDFLESLSKPLSSTAATVHCLLHETASIMFHSHPSSIWTPVTVLLLVAVKLLQYKPYTARHYLKLALPIPPGVPLLRELLSLAGGRSSHHAVWGCRCRQRGKQSPC